MARPEVGSEEVAAVEAVMLSGNLAQGHEVAEFEAEFSAAAVDGAACIAVNSGTSALHLSLLAAGIGPGLDVIVPSFTFAATANAVAMTGATPVFCDITPDTFAMDVNHAASLIGPRTAAIMPVHLYGCPADMVSLCEIAGRHGLMIFEDAAQAHLASINDRPVGTWGTAASFSFYPTKNMTTGEGGMISTHDPALARAARLLRNQGQERRYMNEIVGLNNRMTEMNAAIGRVQLRKLHGWTVRRQQIAAAYSESIVGVVTPITPRSTSHVYHQYTILVPEDRDRDSFALELEARGVQTGVYYPIPVHKLPAYALSTDLPVTSEVARRCLSLPVRPSLTDTEVDQVITAVNAVAAESAK